MYKFQAGSISLIGFREGDFIINQGDRATQLCMVYEGSVTITKSLDTIKMWEEVMHATGPRHNAFQRKHLMDHLHLQHASYRHLYESFHEIHGGEEEGEEEGEGKGEGGGERDDETGGGGDVDLTNNNTINNSSSNKNGIGMGVGMGRRVSGVGGVGIKNVKITGELPMPIAVLTKGGIFGEDALEELCSYGYSAHAKEHGTKIIFISLSIRH